MEEDLIYFTERRLAIEEDEPPIKTTLDLICHNELCLSDQQDDKYFVKINLWQRLFAQVWTFNIPLPTSEQEMTKCQK